MKFATCNEPWGDRPIEDVFARAARIGYTGVEIAPFTLAEDVNQIPAGRRQEIRRAAEAAGIEIVGLHWLFISPKGLHLTTIDAAVRQRSIEYLKALADFCGDLGGKVMVFGSPKQRNLEPTAEPPPSGGGSFVLRPLPHGRGSASTTFDDAWKRASEVFGGCADTCAARGVSLCIEALSPRETNFINTIEQAARLADEIAHPAIDIMLDTKAMSSMPDPIVENIRRFGRRARHFHANEPSGKGVGMPSSADEPPGLDFKPLLRALAESGYDGWVSCEPFDYTPDPDTVAETGLRTLREALAKPR